MILSVSTWRDRWFCLYSAGRGSVTVVLTVILTCGSDFDSHSVVLTPLFSLWF